MVRMHSNVVTNMCIRDSRRTHPGVPGIGIEVRRISRLKGTQDQSFGLQHHSSVLPKLLGGRPTLHDIILHPAQQNGGEDAGDLDGLTVLHLLHLCVPVELIQQMCIRDRVCITAM